MRMDASDSFGSNPTEKNQSLIGLLCLFGIVVLFVAVYSSFVYGIRTPLTTNELVPPVILYVLIAGVPSVLIIGIYDLLRHRFFNALVSVMFAAFLSISLW